MLLAPPGLDLENVGEVIPETDAPGARLSSYCAARLGHDRNHSLLAEKSDLPSRAQCEFYERELIVQDV